MRDLTSGPSLFKVKNGNTIIMCKICSKLTRKTPESSVSIVDFEQENVKWTLIEEIKNTENF